MRQYGQIKQKHADKILLFRLGDFYETFGTDAELTAAACGITLTKRNNGGANEIPLAGFPHHQLDAYLPKLVNAGYRVAVCEQLEDPKQAKGIVKRGVVEVVTPGVVMYDKLLDNKQHTYAACVSAPAKPSGTWGISVIDVSTGTFLCGDVPAERLAAVLDSYSPAEILVDRSRSSDWTPVVGQLGRTPSISKLDEWHFDLEFARTALLRHFDTASLKGFGVEDHLAGVVAAGVLLNYVAETQTRSMNHITSLSLLNANEFMILDASTRRNLEIHASMFAGDSAGALVGIIDKTKSPMGGRLLRWWLQAPLINLQRINKRHELVQSFVDAPDLLSLISRHLGSVGDLERLITKVITGRANARDLIALASGLETSATISAELVDSSNERLHALAKGINDHSEAVALIRSALEPEPPVQVGTGLMFIPGYSAELDEVRNALLHGKDWIKQYQSEQRAATGIEKLKVSFNNVFGYYIEVSKLNASKVPDDYERKQTLTNSERYTTTRLKEIEHALLSAEGKVTALETTLLAALRESVGAYCHTIQATSHQLAIADGLHSFAQVAIQNNYVRPVMADDGVLVVAAGRHPVIEHLLPSGTSYVSNDIALNTQTSQIQLITGPNMSGKSSYLRQTGLIVFLAHVGSFVPAESARIPLTDRIFTRVGAQDNISAGESTFLVEMQESANILNNATIKSLILLDEVGRGTATFDGISIAWAMAEYLHEVVGAKTLFATHYHELTELEHSFERVENVQVEVREIDDSILFTHKVVPGHSDHSFGIHVARMAGLPASVISSASTVLEKLESGSSDQSQGARSAAVDRRALERAGQLTMFTVQDDSLRKSVSELDIENMTPIEALKALADLKGQARG